MHRTQPPRDRRTLLSVFVREVRAQRRLTQIQLQELLAVTQPQYVSKIEVGAIRRPQRQFLEALAEFTGTPIEELDAMCGQTPPESAAAPPAAQEEQGHPGRFRLAFAHCLWGAPIVLAAYRGMLPDFRVASFVGNSGGDEDSPRTVPRLEWMRPENGIPNPVPGPLSPSAPVAPLAAADVVRLLEEQRIDVGVVPGSVIQDETRFLRVGSIVDSPAGCFLVLDDSALKVAGATWAERGRITTDELGILLKEHGKRSKTGKGATHRVPSIGVEESSIAKEFLMRACDSAGLQYRNHMWTCSGPDLAARSFSELKEACMQSGAGQELAGVLTGDPHATWLASMRGKPEPRKIPIYLSPNALGQPTHVTFEVIVNRTTSLSPDFRTALLNLMGALWRIARTISQPASTDEYLRALAVYFAFGQEGAGDTERLAAISHALAGTRHSIRLDMEFSL